MPKRYPLEFRRAVCARLVSGERVAVLADELGVSHQTLYLWKKQALINWRPRQDSNLRPAV